MMNQSDNGWMSGGTNGGTWILMVVGVLVAVLLGVVITKLVSNKS